MRLTQPDLLRIDLALPDGAQAKSPHPEQEHEGEPHLDEHRHQDRVYRHRPLSSSNPSQARSAGARAMSTPLGKSIVTLRRDRASVIMDGSSIDGRPKAPLNLPPKTKLALLEVFYAPSRSPRHFLRRFCGCGS